MWRWTRSSLSSPMSPAATTLPFSMMAKRRAGTACKVDVLLDQDHSEVLDPIEAQDHRFDFLDDVG